MPERPRGLREGTPLVVWDCDGTQQQRWTFHGDGTVRNSGMCRDVENGSVSTEMTIQLWECNGAGHQKFQMGPEIPWWLTRAVASMCGTGGPTDVREAMGVQWAAEPGVDPEPDPMSG